MAIWNGCLGDYVSVVVQFDHRILSYILIYYGLRLCRENRFMRVVLKSDLLIIVQKVKGTCDLRDLNLYLLEVVRVSCDG